MYAGLLDDGGTGGGPAPSQIGTIFDYNFKDGTKLLLGASSSLTDLTDFTEVNPGGSSYTFNSGVGVDISGTATNSFGQNALMLDTYLSALQQWEYKIYFRLGSYISSYEGIIGTIKGDSASIGSLARKDSFIYLRNDGGAGNGDGYRYFNDQNVLTPNTFNTDPLTASLTPNTSDLFCMTITRSMTLTGALSTLKIENVTNPAEQTGTIDYLYSSTSGQLDYNTSKFGFGTTAGSHTVERITLTSTELKNPDYLVITDSMAAYSATSRPNNWFQETKSNFSSLTFTKSGAQDDEPETILNKLMELSLIAPTKGVILDIGINQIRSEGDANTRVDYKAATDWIEANLGITRADIHLFNVAPFMGNTDVVSFNGWLSTEYSDANVYDSFSLLTDGADALDPSVNSGDDLHLNNTGHTIKSNLLIGNL